MIGRKDEHTFILSNLIEVGEKEGVVTGLKGMHASLKCSSTSLLITLKSLIM